ARRVGLSISNAQSTRRRDAFSALLMSLRVLFIRRYSVVDQLRQTHAAFDRIVVREMELRHRVKIEAARKLAAQKTGCARQRRQRLGGVLFSRQMREVHGRMRQIR